jgi:hypothetical protein
MRREYRVVQEDDRFYPEWKSFWTFGKWRRFYYTKDNDLEDWVFLRAYKTEDEAWEFIREKRAQPKFTQFDTERGDVAN